MERIKMAFAGVLMGAVAVAGLGFGLMALLFVGVVGAVTLLAARVAAPVIVKRMERRMQAQGAPVIWDHVPNRGASLRLLCLPRAEPSYRNVRSASELPRSGPL